MTTLIRQLNFAGQDTPLRAGRHSGNSLVSTVLMASPEQHSEPLPIILVVYDHLVNEEMLHAICRQLAEAGYLAFAPALFAGQQTETPDAGTLTDNQIFSALDFVANQAVGHGGDLRRLGLTGFGQGGRIGWLYAAHNPQLRAAVVWNAPLRPAISLQQPLTPLDAAGKLTAPVLGLYGAQDTAITHEEIALMRQALKAAGQPGELIICPETASAWPVAAAGQSNGLQQQMLAWFQRYLSPADPAPRGP